MTNEVKASILNTLNNSQTALLSVINSVDEKQFINQPTDGWSISELVEHIIIVDNSILGSLRKVGATPSKEEIESKFAGAELVKLVSRRNVKVKAPEYFQPKGIFKSKQAAIDGLNAHHATLRDFIDSTTLPLNKIGFPHPLIGMINGEQWLIFMGGHSDRHVNQMKEQLEVA